MKRVTKDSVNNIVEAHRQQGGESLVVLLQNVQAAYGYLPAEALRQISSSLRIPLSRLFEIGTFYNSFSFEPRGKKLISICLGTACHVQNGEKLAGTLARTLGLPDIEGTTKDRSVTVRTVRCLGCCSIAPVIKVDESIHGNMTPAKISLLVNKQKKKKHNGRKKESADT